MRKSDATSENQPRPSTRRATTAADDDERREFVERIQRRARELHGRAGVAAAEDPVTQPPTRIG
jgi:hypothetical protein